MKQVNIQMPDEAWDALHDMLYVDKKKMRELGQDDRKLTQRGFIIKLIMDEYDRRND